ncbi:hypothetical protein PRZ48_005276 [Zasmidium cellare]|uniref:O-methylsterigmatocystin oxidoreductase n=1 Tax=Zasmidium cellare TaxID=395010 RepID=A0ABR0ETC2_ZASCE|nr:hypothetical protein PRZ48_005276 [Zasmidium cellare]
MALDLLEKKAAVHSERPNLEFAYKLCGVIEFVAGPTNSPGVKQFRKLIIQRIGLRKVLETYSVAQEAQVAHHLWRVFQDKGANLEDHIESVTEAFIIKIVYGYNVDPVKADPVASMVRNATDVFSKTLVPGTFLVDFIPVLKYWPSWMPGGDFKNKARAHKKTLDDAADIPYDFVKRKMASGEPPVCFVSEALREMSVGGVVTPEDEHVIKQAAMASCAGAGHTIVPTLEALYLSMSMNPEVQRKAQKEIDRVVGNSRMPTFSDRTNLPYLNAIVMEVQRWHPVVPMGLPHMAGAEDVVEGFRIPKGALFLSNLWLYTRDPQRYHDPEAFMPERYLEPWNEPSPRDLIFGMGRRICPGRTFVDSVMFLTFAQVLAVFDIRKAVDGKGKAIEPTHVFQSGVLSKLGPFQVLVEARSPQHELLIKEGIGKYPWEKSDVDELRVS